MSNEIESLQIKLNVIGQSAIQANIKLDQMLVRGRDADLVRLKAGSRFLDEPELDGLQPNEFRL